MARALSEDLRSRRDLVLIAAPQARQAAARFGVGISSAIRRRSPPLAPLPPPG